MATYIARSTRPPARTYLAQTQQVPLDEKDGIRGVYAYRIESLPRPIHYASLSQAHPQALWVVRLLSVWPVPRYEYELYSHAQAAAKDLVGRRAAYDMQTFSGEQRTYMGTQRCPKRMRPPGGLCGQPPEPGTVWCAWHPFGKIRTDA